jgi:hypothetical protein
VIPPIGSARGIAVSEILLSIPLNDYELGNVEVESQVYCHGILSNGIKYEYSLSEEGHQHILGRSYAGWWAKAMVPLRDSSEKHVLLMRKDGYHVMNTIVPIVTLTSI